MHTILISDFLSLKKVDFLSLKKVIEDSTRRTSTKRYLVISTWVCVCVWGGGGGGGGFGGRGYKISSCFDGRPRQAYTLYLVVCLSVSVFVRTKENSVQMNLQNLNVKKMPCAGFEITTSSFIEVFTAL